MTLKALVIDIEDCKSSNNRVDNGVVISRTLLYTDIFILVFLLLLSWVHLLKGVPNQRGSNDKKKRGDKDGIKKQTREI